MKTLLLLASLLAFHPAAEAQDKKAQDAARRLQAANQRLASEKAQLERDKSQLAQKLAEQEKSSAKELQGARSRHDRELARLRKSSEEQLAQAAEREDALESELLETQDALAEARREGEQLRKRLANQEQTIGFWEKRSSSCDARNAELSKIGNDLIERYRGKTCEDVALENEPFTGLGRARMENLLEDYRERLRAQRVEAPQ